MIALDTDVLTLVLYGDPILTARLNTIPTAEQTVPAIVLGELFRGRLAAIRQAEAGKGNLTLAAAYELFTQSCAAVCGFCILPFSPPAEQLVVSWKSLRLRVGMQDQRIAASCIIHGATLVTRNARDYIQVPGLSLDVWN